MNLLSTIKNWLFTPVRGIKQKVANVQSNRQQRQFDKMVSALTKCGVCRYPLRPNGGFVKYHGYCRKFRHNKFRWDEQDFVKSLS